MPKMADARKSVSTPGVEQAKGDHTLHCNILEVEGEGRILTSACATSSGDLIHSTA